MSEARKGIPRSEETKQKISNSVKRTIKDKPAFKHTEEAKEKIRLAALEQWKKRKYI